MVVAALHALTLQATIDRLTIAVNSTNRVVQFVAKLKPTLNLRLAYQESSQTFH